MSDALVEFLNTDLGPALVLAVQLAIGALVLYVILQFVRARPTGGRWRVAKVVLTILFLPAVLLWKVMTAGSDCGCCVDGDD